MLELVVVLAVLALLAGVVWPTYSQVVADARRREAQALMLEAAAHLNASQGATDFLDEAVDLPAPLRRSPSHGAVHYALSAQPAADGVGFEIRAVPEGPAAADACGTLVLSSTGQRRVASGQTLQRCWR